jgi:hypothetical protein
MAIETKDLVIYKSERLTDNPDGGGKYSGQVIVDGQSNNLFDDISEMDRTMGDVSMRKIFPAVTTADTDKLLGATVFISENPKDPNVSALLFSTKSWTDQRKSAQNRVENYLAKGAQVAGTPLDTHWQGMKTLQVAMFPSESESAVGETIVLVSNEGKPLQHEQYLRITKVDSRIASMMIDGKQVEYKVVTYTINDPLDQDYQGLSAKDWYNNGKSLTIVRESIVADTGEYYSSVALASDISVGDFTVNAESMFTQLIPSAQTETPIVDVNAAGEGIALVPGNDGTITVSLTVTVGASQNMFIGSGVMPGTVSFTLFGSLITDQGGLLKNSSGLQVGTIDYQRGLIQWTASAGSGWATVNLTFKPASAPNQYFQSYSLPVTQQTQSTNWTGVLVPAPAPGSLSISYMSQGKFYELKDDGSGQLKGVSASFGSGRIDYSTGSWLLTTGALPDVDTPILLLWGTPIATFVRSSLPVLPAKIEFDLGETGVALGVKATWMLEDVPKTATSDSKGQFSGDAKGFINYATGKGCLIPNLLPQKGTSFNFEFDYGAGLVQEIPQVIPNQAYEIRFTIGTGVAIKPNSVTLEIPLTSMLDDSLILLVSDDGSGKLLDAFGDEQGSINYSTGEVVASPKINSNYFYTKPVTGFELSASAGGTSGGGNILNPKYTTTYKPVSNPWAGYVSG